MIARWLEHSTKFDRDSIIIANELNQIKIIPKHRDSFDLEYNTSHGVFTLSLLKEEIIDCLQEICCRKNLVEVQPKSGQLITKQLFLEEEGEFWVNHLEKFVEEKHPVNGRGYELGGNRILVTYYEGYIILVDDLGYYKSTILEFNELLAD